MLLTFDQNSVVVVVVTASGGTHSGNILGVVLRQGVRLVFTGTVIGVIAAFSDWISRSRSWSRFLICHHCIIDFF
jgi:hypothetical protein